MTRKGHTNSNATSFGTMDDLTYTYDSGNRLVKISDAAPIDQFGFKDDAVNTAADTSNDYTYDANGNMLTDTNKGITSITYNHLNLPTVVTINGQNINYTYDAAGTKLRKVVSGVTTDYAGNYIYTNNAMQFFNTAEGYFNVTSSNGAVSGAYVYQYKDHLGNIRLSYSDTNNNGSIAQSEIVEESNYYPFGLAHRGYNNTVSPLGNSTAQKFGYNGKELNEELGIQWHDFGARNYDAALGRWFGVDNLSEKYHPISPYTYTLNNPIIYSDPDGNDVILKIAGERMKGYKKFISTKAGRAFVSQFLKKDDKIPGTNIKIKESGKYSNETLSFRTARLRGAKGRTETYFKNEDGSRGKLTRGARRSDIKNANGNYELTIFLNKDDRKADDVAVTIGHEAFVHGDKSLKQIDKVRGKIKGNKYKNVGEFLSDITSISGGADKDHVKLSKGLIKLFVAYVKQLDKVEGTGSKYQKKYKENKDKY